MSFKEEYSEYLEHYGIRGMRWGVRKTSAISNKSTKKKRQSCKPVYKIFRNKG